MALDFTAKGLVLISGPTGAGKSTLCDLVPWVLFGKTAKGGAADEIRPWSTTDTTVGQIEVNDLTIIRTRAPNDLYVIKYGYTIPTRGKDIPDTQKYINTQLGIDYETYLAGAYFHEFSQTAQFFTSPAKLRRAIIEELTDLSFAVELTEGLSQYRSELKKSLQDEINELLKQQAIAHALQVQLTNARTRRVSWATSNKKELEALLFSASNYESQKQGRICDINDDYIRSEVTLLLDISGYEEAIRAATDELSKISGLEEKIEELRAGKCGECGNQLHSDKILILTRQVNHREALKAKLCMAEIHLVSARNRLDSAKQRRDNKIAEVSLDNDLVSRIAAVKSTVNPHAAVETQISAEVDAASDSITSKQREVDELKLELSDVELLLSLIDELRASCVKSSIVDLQTRTNRLLTEYFDAEIKVSFSASGADKIDVEVFKEGSQCSYTQLSKGQRQMLKLCFGVSVMQIVGNKTQGFNTWFFDEVTDGWSEELSVKAYRLFEGLTITAGIETILVVTHSEGLKAQFNNRIEVELIDGVSTCQS